MSDTAGKKYYGKYMGVVVNNINPDPQAVAYIQVTVPDVLGLAPSSWAKPCVPVAGLLQSGVFLVPPIGSSVWVEFEQGDPGRPILDRRFLGVSDGGAFGGHDAAACATGSKYRDPNSIAKFGDHQRCSANSHASSNTGPSVPWNGWNYSQKQVRSHDRCE